MYTLEPQKFFGICQSYTTAQTLKKLRNLGNADTTFGLSRAVNSYIWYYNYLVNFCKQIYVMYRALFNSNLLYT